MTRDTSAYPTLRHYITVYGEQTEKLLRSYVDVESSGARDQIATARIETIEALQVLEQTAAGELSRAVSAKTADSDAIQRLARMDGYDDVAPSPVPSSAADEGRHAPSQTPSGGPAHQSDQKTDAQ